MEQYMLKRHDYHVIDKSLPWPSQIKSRYPPQLHLLIQLLSLLAPKKQKQNGNIHEEQTQGFKTVVPQLMGDVTVGQHLQRNWLLNFDWEKWTDKMKLMQTDNIGCQLLVYMNHFPSSILTCHSRKSTGVTSNINNGQLSAIMSPSNHNNKQACSISRPWHWVTLIKYSCY